jgi:apolipoprotein N-acyltransferase
VDYFGDETTGWIAKVALAMAPLLLTLLQAVPFLLVPAGGPPHRRAIGLALAMLATIFPPLGLLSWRNPLLSAGVLMPGSGWIGVGLCILIMAGIAGWPDREIPRRFRALLMLPLLLAASGLVAWDAYAYRQTPQWQAAAMRSSIGWMGINTRQVQWMQGSPADTIATLAMPYLGPGVRGLVFPEAVLSPITDADRVMLMPLHEAARENGTLILIGASSYRDSDGHWRNGVYALGAAQGWVDDVRVPMPAGHWRPVGGVRPRPLATDIVTLAGQRIAFSICFEDTILWPHRGLLSGQADLLVSMGNTWAINSHYIQNAQTISAQLLAQLAAVPLIRSTNVPG